MSVKSRRAASASSLVRSEICPSVGCLVGDELVQCNKLSKGATPLASTNCTSNPSQQLILPSANTSAHTQHNQNIKCHNKLHGILTNQWSQCVMDTDARYPSVTVQQATCCRLRRRLVRYLMSPTACSMSKLGPLRMAATN